MFAKSKQKGDAVSVTLASSWNSPAIEVLSPYGAFLFEYTKGTETNTLIKAFQCLIDSTWADIVNGGGGNAGQDQQSAAWTASTDLIIVPMADAGSGNVQIPIIGESCRFQGTSPGTVTGTLTITPFWYL